MKAILTIAAAVLTISTTASALSDYGDARARYRQNAVVAAEANGPSPGGRDTALYAEANGPSPGGRDTAMTVAEA